MSSADHTSGSIFERLRRVSPSTLGHFRDRGLISTLEPIRRPINFAGAAFTIKSSEYGATGFLDQLGDDASDTVLVISRPEDTNRTFIGGIVAAHLKKKNIAGIIIDGPITDYLQLLALELPVFHRGVTPVVGKKTNEPLIFNVPVVIGGTSIDSGDFVFADSDGIGVLTPQEVTAVVDQLEEAEQKEKELFSELGLSI